MEQCIAYLHTAQFVLSTQILQNNATNQRAIVKRKNELFLKQMFQQQQLFNISQIMFNNSLYMANMLRSKRSIWMKERSSDFWVRIVQNHFSEKDWVESFRMKKSNFTKLCSILKTDLEPKQNPLKSREPLSVEKQVAIALYKLASTSEYRVVGNVFGVHKSTIKKCIYRVVKSINKRLLPKEIFMPDENEANYIAKQFEDLSHIPQIIGCIDGSHIPILAPEEGFRDFVNRKGWPSYVLQAVVDHNGCFRSISCKSPGSAHDALVFKNSGLYKYKDHLIPKGTRQFHGVNIPYMIIGDPAYPLLEWVLKDYPRSDHADKESFNVYLNSARVKVEHAFGRLKGRWRILLKRIDLDHKFVPEIVAAVCTLHNFVEREKEKFDNNWLHDVQASELIYSQPIVTTTRERDLFTASIIRDHIKNYLAINFPLRKSFSL